MPWWDDVVEQTENELEELDHLEEASQVQAPVRPDPGQAVGPAAADDGPGGSSLNWSGQIVDAAHKVESDASSVARYETEATEAREAAAEAHSLATADSEMGYEEQDPDRAADYFESAAAREREAQELERQAQQADREAAEARRWESWDRITEGDLVERQRMAVEHQSGYDYQQAKAEGDRVMQEAREASADVAGGGLMGGHEVGPDPAEWPTPPEVGPSPFIEDPLVNTNPSTWCDDLGEPW